MKKITFEFALAALTVLLLSGCGGSDTESNEQADLQSTYMSDFEWAVRQMEDVYHDYGIETGAWRLLEVREIYLTSANEMNGADYAVTMYVEFAKKMPGAQEWVEGGASALFEPTQCGENRFKNANGLTGNPFKPAEPIKFQVASWDGHRQLPCLTEFKERMAKWSKDQ